MAFPIADPGTAPVFALTGDPCVARREEVATCSAKVTRLRRLADESAGRLRYARRAWSAASDALVAAQLDTDRALFSAAKEELRGEYRRALEAAGDDRGGRGTAATAWLQGIDRLNRVRARATIRLSQSGAQLSRLQHAVSRLSSEADAARISVEAAADAFRDARLALAACEESDDAPRVLSDGHGPRPLILRLLDGERQMLPRVGAALAYDAGIDDGHTQLLLSELVEAINASALAEDAFDFPNDHPFWSVFSAEDCRALIRSLRSLGYGPDGAGGWVHRRAPTLRDIAMAITHIGLEPRRLRHMPTVAEIEELFRDVRLRGDRFLLFRAPDLSLDEMLAALGPRSEQLSPLWDAWGRLRPLLMTTEDVASIE